VVNGKVSLTLGKVWLTLGKVWLTLGYGATNTEYEWFGMENGGVKVS